MFLKTEILDVTFGEKPENRKKRRKIGILQKSNHTYTSLMQLNHTFWHLHTTEESLFEI
jgi:hypothetical protein